jgi:hypothetical protein
MKKIICLLVFAAFACTKKDDANATAVSTDSASVKKAVMGADTDMHGCKGSAGYTWSELHQDCVRIFEKGVSLKASGDTANIKMPAFVLLKDDRAEVFIQTEKPFILQRNGPQGVFKNGEWELLHTTGYKEKGKTVKHAMYILSKNGEILFFAGQPGQ